MSKINGKKVSKKNQLHDFLDYDLDNLVFADATEGAVPNSNPPVKFFRINVLAKNAKLKEIEDEDGNVSEVPELTEAVIDDKGVVTDEPKMVMSDTMGDFMITLDRMFSFGVSESTDPVSQKVTGHSISLCMYSKEGPTEREIKTVDKFEELIQKFKDYLISVRKSVKQPLLEMSDLKNMGKLLYWKKDEDGNKVPGIGPTLSPKLIEFKASVDSKGVEKPYQMVTTFYLEDEIDDEGNPREVDPLSFLSDNANKKFKLCYVRPVVKIDSIFIGSKISIQCKITEADIAPVQAGAQRLLHGRHKIKENSKTIINSSSSSSSKGINPLLSTKKSVVKDDDEESEDHDGEKNESPKSKPAPAEDELKDEPAPKKKVVKKVVKKAE
ncbi:MAG: DUF2738 domain-containing protein [Candidatus Colwellbacteria bacterium]|nr:DUF2738 domain-containing protein [Candidatus Colwellbacteria bacterium]